MDDAIGPTVTTFEDALHAIRVLLIDDSQDDFFLTRALLRKASGGPYEIEWAPSYETGLEALRTRAFQACFLDYGLGPHTGLEMLAELHHSRVTTPVILLTGMGDDGIEHEALARGAADYLVKGKFDPDSLERAVRHAIERTRALDALKTSERLFRAVFDGAHDAMLLWDDQGRYLDGNPAALAMFDLTRDELRTRRVGELGAGADTDLARFATSRLLHEGSDASEWEYVGPSGEPRVIECRSTAHIQPGCNLTIVRDISERRQAERTRARLAAIVTSAEDAIIGIDREGTIREWNAGAERLYGASAAEVVNGPMTRFLPDERESEWLRLQESVERGEHVRNFETFHRNHDGKLIELSLSASPIHDPRGRVVGSSMIARDISTTKALRTRVAISDRLASLGMLAAGVIHEINNPLTAVMAGIEAASLELERVSDRDERPIQDAVDGLRDALSSSERIRQIVGDLRLFSRNEEDKPVPVDVRQVLESTLRMAWNQIRHRAHLVKVYDDMPPVDANEGRLGQVFLNLLVNAAQAIPEGDVDRHEIRVITRHQDGRVLIDIEDTGAGIPPEKLERIFEPFYTTKPTGVGTGLGLSICRGILADYKGELTITSQVGRGTTARVSLPAGTLGQALARPPTPEPSAPLARRRARVLVIDDEPILVKLFVRALETEHQATGVTLAREALHLIAAGERYDMILCDLMMPEMTGMELHAELMRIAPEMASKVVFLTGGIFTARTRAFLKEIPNKRIDKPLPPSRLLALVRQFVQ